MSSSTDESVYTDDEIYRMRSWLARRWNQTISQVTDAEAKAYLNADREMKASSPATGDLHPRTQEGK